MNSNDTSRLQITALNDVQHLGDALNAKITGMTFETRNTIGSNLQNKMKPKGGPMACFANQPRIQRDVIKNNKYLGHELRSFAAQLSPIQPSSTLDLMLEKSGGPPGLQSVPRSLEKLRHRNSKTSGATQESQVNLTEPPSVLSQLGQGKSTKSIAQTRSNSLAPANNRTQNVALINKKAMQSRKGSVQPRRLAPLQNAGNEIMKVNSFLKGNTANFCESHIPRVNKALNETMMKTKLSFRELPESPRKSIDLEQLKVEQRKKEKREISERKAKLDTLIAMGEKLMDKEDQSQDSKSRTDARQSELGKISLIAEELEDPEELNSRKTDMDSSCPSPGRANAFRQLRNLKKQRSSFRDTDSQSGSPSPLMKKLGQRFSGMVNQRKSFGLQAKSGGENSPKGGSFATAFFGDQGQPQIFGLEAISRGTSFNPNEAFYERHKEMFETMKEDSTSEKISESEYVEAENPKDTFEMKGGEKKFQTFDPIHVIPKKKISDLENSFYSDKNEFPHNIDTLCEMDVKQQFFSVKKKELKLTVEQKKEIDKTFFDAKVKDPTQDKFMMALAKVKAIKPKQESIIYDEDMEKYQMLINLFLGQRCPEHLLETIATKLNKYMFTDKFREFIKDKTDENVFEKFGQEIRDKRLYNHIIRQKDNTYLSTNNEKNYVFEMVRACIDKQVPCSPILFKIFEGRLRLENYVIRKEVVKSLAKCCIKFPMLIEKCTLINNNLRDKEVGILIDGFYALKRITSLIIKNNEFGALSFKSIYELLDLGIMCPIEEFRLINCRTEPKVMSDLFDQLLISNCLQRFALVKMQLTTQHVPRIIKLIKQYPHLKELDLSFNDFTSKEMMAICEALAPNRTLTIVNLSWNFLSPAHDATLPIPERDTDNQFAALQQHYIQQKGLNEQAIGEFDNINDDNYEERLKAYLERIEKLELAHPMHEDNKEIVQYITRFIKRNKKLLQLNLDSTQLSEWMLFHISVSLRRSTSCVSFHASGNPGMTPEFRELIWRRLKCKNPYAKVNRIDYEKDWKRDMATSGHRGRKIKENLEVRDLTRRRLEDVTTGIRILDNKFIVTRQLGHKIDLPLAGQWKLVPDDEKCWIYGNYVYTLFFWSRKSGNIANEEEADGVQRQYYVDQVDKMFNLTDMECTVPHISFQGSNWEPRPMKSIKEFCYSVDDQKPDFFAELKESGKIGEEKENEKQLDKYEASALRQAIKEQYEYSYNTYPSVAQTMNRGIRYRNTFTIDMDLLNDHHDKFFQKQKFEAKKQKRLDREKNAQFRAFDIRNFDENGNLKEESVISSDEDIIEDVFVFPCFLKPGRHKFLITQDNPEFENEKDFYLHNIIAPQRVDNIPGFAKSMKSKFKERHFERKSTVFAPWRDDQDEDYKVLTECDAENWKLKDFVADEEDQELVKQVLAKHQKGILNLFRDMAAKSNYPQVSGNQMLEVAKQFNFLHQKFMKIAYVETNMIGAMKNDVKYKGGNKIQGSLARCEFVEVLIRSAKQRFVDSKVMTSVGEAFELLLTEHVFANVVVEDWTQFRQQKLWTLGCADLYEANMRGINQLMERFHEPRKNTFTMIDARSLLMKEIDIGCTEMEITQCWGFSKMTVKNEVKDYFQYNNLKMIEFLEFLARIADVRFPGEQPLEEKIEKLLDCLFPLVGFERKLVNTELEVESQSDDEY